MRQCGQWCRCVIQPAPARTLAAPTPKGVGTAIPLVPFRQCLSSAGRIVLIHALGNGQSKYLIHPHAHLLCGVVGTAALDARLEVGAIRPGDPAQGLATKGREYVVGQRAFDSGQGLFSPTVPDLFIKP